MFGRVASISPSVILVQIGTCMSRSFSRGGRLPVWPSWPWVITKPRSLSQFSIRRCKWQDPGRCPDGRRQGNMRPASSSTKSPLHSKTVMVRRWRRRPPEQDDLERGLGVLFRGQHLLPAVTAVAAATGLLFRRVVFRRELGPFGVDFNVFERLRLLRSAGSLRRLALLFFHIRPSFTAESQRRA